MNKGFTLAEVLITLGVIGVVAAITLPTLFANINERINSERQANIAQKVTQAMEQMRAHGLLNTQYASTDAFVDELQKYLKVAKRCSASNIADCWPTDKVTTAEGEEYEVKEARKGKHINHKENKTNNVGLILADGASLIMTYNPNSQTIDIGDRIEPTGKTELPVGNGKMKEFPYTTNVTGSIAFVMDVNGAKGPNSEKIGDRYNDIRSFNGAQFTQGIICDFEVGNLCVKKLDSYACISEPPYTACTGNNNCNCWAGAKKACSDIDMTLASRGNLNTIYQAKLDGLDGARALTGLFWSSEEATSESAWYKNFKDSDNGFEGHFAKYSGRIALCVD